MSIENDPRASVAVGTVIWGVILLVIAGVSFTLVTFDVSILTPAVIGWTVVGLGALLVIAAMVWVVARGVRSERAGSPVSTGSTGSTTEGHQPIG